MAIRFALTCTLLVLLALPSHARADEGADAQRYERALRWLVAQQHENGGFGEIPGQYEGEIGITAIVTRALADAPDSLRSVTAPALERATRFILAAQRKDGSFVQGRSGLPTYRTAVAIMALAAVDREKHREAIAKAAAWLTESQIDDKEGIGKEDVRHGGFFYGPAGDARGRRVGADLSNTVMALAALHDAGIPQDDPVYTRALTFLRRCQNDSEVNDGAGFKPSDDGGFVYNPVPGPRNVKQPRSYAGMTYAGLLSLAYAGASPDDPSVKAALGWIERNYTLEENRGLGAKASGRTTNQAGLYYYYYTFSKCLQHLGRPTLQTEEGQRRWARDLYDALAARQRKDGSFVNSDGTWWESNPVLVTAYALSAMNFARPYLNAKGSKQKPARQD